MNYDSLTPVTQQLNVIPHTPNSYLQQCKLHTPANKQQIVYDEFLTRERITIRMLKRTTLKCSTRGNSPRYVPDTQTFQAKKRTKDNSHMARPEEWRPLTVTEMKCNRQQWTEMNDTEVWPKESMNKDECISRVLNISLLYWFSNITSTLQKFYHNDSKDKGNMVWSIILKRNIDLT